MFSLPAPGAPIQKRVWNRTFPFRVFILQKSIYICRHVSSCSRFSPFKMPVGWKDFHWFPKQSWWKTFSSWNKIHCFQTSEVLHYLYEGLPRSSFQFLHVVMYIRLVSLTVLQPWWWLASRTRWQPNTKILFWSDRSRIKLQIIGFLQIYHGGLFSGLSAPVLPDAWRLISWLDVFGEKGGR